MNQFEIISHSPSETRKLGKEIGKLVMPGDILLLTGNLGTGKTCFTQGVARGLGILEHIPSPSYVLVREFDGRLPLYHMDLYRLEHLEEVADLGLDDYLYGKGVCVIEWAEKGIGLMPPEHLLIKVEYTGDKERRFIFEPQGQHYVKLMETLKEKSHCIWQ